MSLWFVTLLLLLATLIIFNILNSFSHGEVSCVSTFVNYFHALSTRLWSAFLMLLEVSLAPWADYFTDNL